MLHLRFILQIKVLLGKFEKEKTKPVTYQDLPPHLIYALYAKEDERFQGTLWHRPKISSSCIFGYTGKFFRGVALPLLSSWQNYFSHQTLPLIN